VQAALGLGGDTLVVGFAGRWTEATNPLAVVAIARRIPAERRIRCLVFGAGPLAEPLAAARDAAGLDASRLAILGYVPDLVPYLSCMDAMLCPSQRAGQHQLALEARASGIPVVAARTGVHPDLIQDGLTGWLCDGADIGGFVARICWLADHPAERARMAQAARQSAEADGDEYDTLFTCEMALRNLLSAP
jgi:glycosyltransferase involved in cell wall biosynthesis